MRILAVSGSLRKESFNTRLLRALPPLAPEGMEIEVYERLGDLPPFNQDLEADPALLPEPVEHWRGAIREADGLLLVTPEFNGSIPGVVKNAVDWASRPVSASALLGKNVVVMVGTPGRGLGRNCLADLTRVLHDCHANVVGGPALVLYEAAGKLEDVKDEESGVVTSTITDQFARQIAVVQLASLAEAVTEDAGRHAAAPLRAFIAAMRPPR
jgi:chromate reductase, NAD(P)H dehydrogenase (quinone)